MNAPLRILIIKPSSLGDIVHALPVLAAVRRSYPSAHIAWLVGANFEALLRSHPLIDETIPFDRAHYGKMWRSWRAFADFWRLVRDLRRRKFDLVIDLQGLIRSGLMAYFSGARQRVGFAAAREFAWLFYSRRVRIPSSVKHAVEHNLHLAREVGLTIEPVDFPLAITDAERDRARQLLESAADNRPVPRITAIVIGARWSSKIWPADRFTELIDRLHLEGEVRCVLLGAPSDRTISDEIIKRAGRPPLDLVGRTNLRELTALLELAERVICLDSGPMHIAAALGKPVVAIFGPTNAAKTGPYSPLATVVSKPLACSPCYRRNCPLGHHACMKELTVADLLSQVRKSQTGKD